VVIPGVTHLFPNRFCRWRELDHIQICWAITGSPRYLGCVTMTVASEPIVEWVAEVVHSMGGRSGTHMLPRVPTGDSMVRPWG
jgi:hypothetical protein